MDRLISEKEVLDVIASWFESVEQQRILKGRIKAIPSAEPRYYPPCEDCHKKMNEIRKAYDKIPSTEQYKGMTNGEVITKILKDAEWAEISSDFALVQEDTIHIKVGSYWWNSPYKGEQK